MTTVYHIAKNEIKIGLRYMHVRTDFEIEVSAIINEMIYCWHPNTGYNFRITAENFCREYNTLSNHSPKP